MKVKLCAIFPGVNIDDAIIVILVFHFPVSIRDNGRFHCLIVHPDCPDGWIAPFPAFHVNGKRLNVWKRPQRKTRCHHLEATGGMGNG
jgi:hypothetical protein